MIAMKNEVKTLVKHMACVVNTNSKVQHVIQIKNGIMTNVNVSVKNILCKKNYCWNPSTCFFENGISI